MKYKKKKTNRILENEITNNSTHIYELFKRRETK